MDAFAPAEVHRLYLAAVFRDHLGESIGRDIRHLHAFRRQTGVSPVSSVAAVQPAHRERRSSPLNTMSIRASM
jgi:AraC-like DNA-binding protein